MTTYTSTAKPERSAKADLLKRAKRDFKKAVDGWSKQRKREMEDLAFQVPENQWTTLAKQQRQGGESGGVTTAARPMISISQIQQPIQLVKNQAAAADLGVNIHPVSETASGDTAEVFQGLYRRIERDNNAEQIRLFAFDRATQCGVGWYRIITRWDEDGDDEWDQEIAMERLLYQGSVYIDPAAQKADFSDAEFAFIVQWLTKAAFERKYPNANVAPEGAFEDADSDDPEWTKIQGEEKVYQIAEYIYKKHDYKEITDPESGRKRERDIVSVKSCTLSGSEVLEEEDWPGKHIPLIPVLGRELQPFDGERRIEGMIRPARDAQQFFNAAASTLVERMFLEPKVPFIGYEGQFTDKGWSYVNTRNLPYIQVPTRVTGSDGQTLPLPQRAVIDQGGMSVAAMALQEAKGFVQSATAVYDPSLGETPKRGQSGRAVIAQQQQSDAGTSNYLQNLANISMQYEAKVILDLIPKIYDRPGRITRILSGEDEKEKTVMLGQPFVMDQSGDKPIPAAPGQQNAKMYDLSKGKYAISVTIGKSYQTRMQQGQETFGPLMEHMPPDVQLLLLPTWLKFQDTPGSKEAEELMKKYRDSKFPGLVGDKGEQPTAEQLQAKMQGMEQAGQELQKQLQAAGQQIQTDQAKQQAQIAIAKINADKEIQLQKMKDAASIAVAEINARAKGVLSAQEAMHESVALDQEQAHELGMQAMDQAHQQQQVQQGQAFQAAQDQSGQAFQAAQDASGQAHEAALAAMPPPAPPAAPGASEESPA